MVRPATRLALAGCLALGFAAIAAADEPKIPPTILQAGGVSAPPAKKDAPKTDPAEAEALTKLLRDLVKKNLPDPLAKSSQNWDHQKAVTVVHHHREGLRVWSEPVEEMRNDGVWRRTAVRIPEPDKLALAVTELTHPEPGKMLATVAAVAERVDIRFEQQIWKKGLRLYGGETRGHCKGALLLKAEVVTKTEFKKGSFFPEVTLTLKVTGAEIFYENLVVDHTAGLGGDTAKVLGDVMIDVVKAVKPHLEEELLQKANAAVVKAAGTREFRVALDQLLSPKAGKQPEKK
jgi:hypothetical protein